MSSQRIPLMHFVKILLIPSIRISSVCVARNATCFKCKKEGHFSKMCRSNPKITSASICSHRLATMLISNTTSASLGSLKQAALYVLVGKNGAGTALMDIGSSGSFISFGCERKHRLQMKPAAGNVSMASSSLKASIKEQCIMDINLLGEWYPDVIFSSTKSLFLAKISCHNIPPYLLHSGTLRKIL